MTAAKKLVREYELIYIMRPSVLSADAKKVSDRITEVIEKFGAKLIKVDHWGKRKLAYPIDKHSRGIFVYLRFAGPTDVIAELERHLRIFDTVIRYQTVRLEDLFDMATLEVDAEEIEFVEIDDTLEEEPEPSIEERLGMPRPRERRPEAPAAPEGEAAEGEPKAEGTEEGAEPKAEAAAEAPAASAEAPAAETPAAETPAAEAPVAETPTKDGAGE